MNQTIIKKAVILAGGLGSRLSPITDDIPKPLLPICGTSLCERIIKQLCDCGIDKIMIPIGYRGDMIKNAIGSQLYSCNISYLEEALPLGTAGGLKYARSQLKLLPDESFVVIAGDCVCDYDFVDIMNYHTSNNCVATIVTAQCDNPLEYGVVFSDGGMICGFNEKPPWSQVNCNRVNTGIYVLKESVIDMIPSGLCDFSKDLFPALLKDGQRLCEYRASGYWCDIGTPESYYKCCVDVLSGKLLSNVKADKCQLEKYKSDGVEITEPCYIHPEAHVSRGAKIGPNTIIEKGCVIEEAKVSGSIVHENTHIGQSSRVEGAIICHNCNIGKDCIINGGSVIAGNVTLENSFIPSGTCITSDGDGGVKYSGDFCTPQALFSNELGVFLGDKACSFSESSVRFGACVAAAMGAQSRVGIMHDKEASSYLYSRAVLLGLCKGAALAFDFGEGFSQLARFTACHFYVDCFLFIKCVKGKILCEILNRNGLSPSRDFERRLEACFKSYSPRQSVTPTRHHVIDSMELHYYSELCDNLCAYSRDYSSISAAFSGDSDGIRLLKKAFDVVGGKTIYPEQAHEKSNFCLVLGGKNAYISQSNYKLDKYHMTAEIIKEEAKRGSDGFAVPYVSPKAYGSLFGGSSVLFYPAFSGKRFNIPRGLLASSYYINDEIMLFARFLSLLAYSKKNLSEYCRSGEEFAFHQRVISLPQNASKASIITELCGKSEKYAPDCYEGIKISYPNGTVTVVPGKAMSFRLYSEAASSEVAKQLCDMVSQDINRLCGEK